MSAFYICRNNKDLYPVQSIHYDLFTPFLYRKLRKEGIDNSFFHNGSQLQYVNSNDEFVTLVMDIDIDDDRIIDVSCAKYKDMTSGHGKPVTKEMTVTKADYKELTTVLSDITFDSTEEEYQNLIERLSANSTISSQIKSITSKGITFLDANKKPVLVKKAEIEWAIWISHSFIDVLFSEQALLKIKPQIREEIIPLLCKIVSCVDTSNYYRRDILLQEYEDRKVRDSAEEGYANLCKAVRNNNYDKASMYKEYARICISDEVENTPLIMAVKHNNADIIRMLVENGAYTRAFERDKNIFALDIAVSKRNMEVIKLLVTHNGVFCNQCGYGSKYKYNTDRIREQIIKSKDYELLRLLSPGIYSSWPETWLQPKTAGKLTKKDIEDLVEVYDARIAWTLDIVQPLYEQKNRDFCLKMLHQGCSQEVIEYFIEQNDYEMFEASTEQYSSLTGSGTAYEPVYEREKEWFDCLCQHSVRETLPNGRIKYEPEKSRDKFFVKLLDNAEFDRYIRDIQLLDVQELHGSLGDYHYIFSPEKCTNPKAYCEFAHYMLDHYQFNQRFTFIEDIVKYFGDEDLTHKYNMRCPLAKDTYSETVDTFWAQFIHHELVPKYIEDRKVTLIAAAEIIRCCFGIEPFENKETIVANLAVSLGQACQKRCPLSGPEEWDKRYKRATNCMIALLEKVSLDELDEVVKAWSKYEPVDSTYDLFTRWKISYQPMLDLIKH